MCRSSTSSAQEEDLKIYRIEPASYLVLAFHARCITLNEYADATLISVWGWAGEVAVSSLLAKYGVCHAKT